MEIESIGFFSYMQKHRKLVRYISVSSKGTSKTEAFQDKFSEYKQKEQQKCVSRLNQVSAKLSEAQSTHRISAIQKPQYMCKEEKFIFHRLRFIENYINKFDAKIEKLRKSLVEQILDIYNTPDLIPKTFVVITDTSKIYSMVKRKKKLAKLMKEKHQLLHNELKERLSARSKKLSHDSQKEEILRILTLIRPSFDKSLAFFCPSQFQDPFEDIFFNPEFICAEMIQKTISTFPKTPPSDFVAEIVQIVEKIGNLIEKCNDTFSLSCLIGLIFRALFDEVYDNVRLFSVPELSFDLIGQLRDATVSTIDPPGDCCPPQMKKTDQISAVFRNDSNYFLAVEQVEFISFFTNPLDILHHIYHSLCEIEKGAHVYGGEKEATMMSFDVTFGLFLCVLLASDIPELLRIAMFTTQYSPSRGLSPDFEFALAKLSTASVHLQNLAQKKLN